MRGAGGPGASSTGFGNFGEIGPLDIRLQPRNTTWINVANVLFIDSPVGAGYSYMASGGTLTTNVQQIVSDLVATMADFLARWPVFRTRPLWIFSESYGGKVAAVLGNALVRAIQDKQIVADFRGVALGDAWVAPMDSVNTWAPYLRATSLVDAKQEASVKAVADRTQQACDEGRWVDATRLWAETENVIQAVTDNVDFYHILRHNVADDGLSATVPEGVHNVSWMTPAVWRAAHRLLQPLPNNALPQLMNGPIRAKLGIIPAGVTWGGQANRVFQAHAGDFMKDVIDAVDQLLANTSCKVIVYNGQLDLIVDTPGTERWVQRLKWSGMPAFHAAPKQPLYPNPQTSNTGAFVKEYGNLAFYYVLSAGHMVPTDAGDMALRMVERIFSSSP